MLLPFFVSFFHKYKVSALSLLAIFGVTLGVYGISIGHNYWPHNSFIGTSGLLIPAIFGALHLSKKYHYFQPYQKVIVIVLFCICLFNPIKTLCSSILIDLKTNYSKLNYHPDPEITKIIDKYSTTDNYILLKDNAVLYTIWDRKHPFAWSTMIDQLIMLYPGKTEDEKLSKVRSEIESKLPVIIYIPPNAISLNQVKHLDKVVYPIIQKYQYIQVVPHLYILNK